MDTKQKILAFIEMFIRTRGHYPTPNDIAQGVWMNPTAVWSYLWQLKGQERIAFDDSRKHAVKLLPVKPALPWFGTVK